MSAAAAPRIVAPPGAARRRLLVFPREHGAWGMLFVPLATGALVALRPDAPLSPLLLLIAAAFALFCLRTPIEALLGTSAVRATGETERSFAASWAMIYAAVAGLAISALLQTGYSRGLLAVGAVVGLAFAAQLVLRRLGRSVRIVAQIVGAAGLTSTAAAGCLVVSGRLDATAFALWAVNFAFAAGQVHYVQVRIHQTRPDGLRARLRAAPGFLLGQLLLLFALDAAAAFRLLPWLAVAAILPTLARGFYWYLEPARPLDVHRLGRHELAHAIAFGMLLVAAFRL
jgi:hypothetical protein